MIRLSKLVKEGEEPKKFTNEVKKHFLEIVSTYAKYQEMLDRKSDIAEIAEILGGITEAARELAVNEADNWFDANTVKRNMNELTKLGKSFDQVALEAKALDERLNALYEDMGHILSRYYKIGDITEEQMQERLGLREDGKLQGELNIKTTEKIKNHIPTYDYFINESSGEMIKDIIEKAKLTQRVKNNRVDIGWKHDWLKRPKIVKALTALKKYETSVDTVKYPGGVFTKFIKKYDDGIDTLEVVYDRNITKSS
jgi:hypothetical protein